MAALARRILTLKGGRQLGYVLLGAADPQINVIYHHGWPSSAQEVRNAGTKTWVASAGSPQELKCHGYDPQLVCVG
jgi:hypothetical protein